MLILALLLLLPHLLSWARRAHAVAFLHPYCNAAGGGQKVLWAMVYSLLLAAPGLPVYIYTVQQVPDAEILQKVKQAFRLDLDPYANRIHFVRLRLRLFTRPAPRLTMLIQVVGDFLLGLQALLRVTPRLLIDSTGLPFSALNKLLFSGVSFLSYVHYPFIGEEMIQKVIDREEDYNNRGIGRSALLTYLKVAYYKLLLFCYACTGRLVSGGWVNSSWTKSHMDLTWGPRLKLAFPPCSIGILKQVPPKQHRIVSFAQFRPQKNHMLQVAIYKRLKQVCQLSNLECPQLLMMGSCRNRADQELLRGLQTASEEQGLGIQFGVNEPFGRVKQLLAGSKFGLHTMKAEHFGITVVEMMSYGVVVTAHNSAGPKLDIIQEGGRRGFLACDQEEFLQALLKCVRMGPTELAQMQAEAMAHSASFSDQAFVEGMKLEFAGLFGGKRD